ncbi:MAG: tetratricopeptide repeat protein [Chlorobiaceae bacterium]|nr:tetratricopeptide repeat protein [Chlorobiaceae bacterium]
MNELANKLQAALILHQQGNLSQAESLYSEVIRRQPANFDALFLLATAYAQQRRFEDALTLFDRAMRLNSHHPETLNNRGNVLMELKRYEDAIASFDQSLSVRPGDAETYTNRGVALEKLERYEEAVTSYESAITLNPNNPLTYNNYGVVLQHLKKFDEALLIFDKAVQIKQNYAEAYNNRGNVLRELERYDDALESFDRALLCFRDYPEVFNNQGNTFLQMNRIEDAIYAYKKAVSLKPDYVEAYSNLGKALIKLKRYEESVHAYRKAIALKSDDPELYNSLGHVYFELKRYKNAIGSYENAVSVKPDYAEVYARLGFVYEKIKRYDFAVENYEKALVLKPDIDNISGQCDLARMMIHDWSKHYNKKEAIIDEINKYEYSYSPFHLLALIDNPPIHKEIAERFGGKILPQKESLPVIDKRPYKKKIRIGYFSADFRTHPVSFLISGMIESHNKECFEIFAFAFGPDSEDEMKMRLCSAFDHFIDVRAMSDLEVAELSRKMEIDIAVDLGGYTSYNRIGIFSYRAAPLQLNFLGFPGTMGVEYLDYIIADHIVIPEHSREYYTEKIIYMPDTYLPNDDKREISDKIYTRREFGLPEKDFVFCCFNNNYKFNPAVFDCWMNILRRVNHSVLWLREGANIATENLRREAKSKGIDPDRLIFAGHVKSGAEYLSRQRIGDLFLDTIPYNAHTTACDALWAGLPVLTLMGESFQTRVASSVLHAVGLSELVTRSRDEYENLAVELAKNPEKLKAIREKLDRNRLTTPLFDTKLFTRNIEKAYTMIYERYHAGLQPDHIFVEPED